MIVETLYLSAKSNNQKGKKDSNIKFPNYIRWIILSNASNILDGVETSATFWYFCGKQSKILFTRAFVLHSDKHLKVQLVIPEYW